MHRTARKVRATKKKVYECTRRESFIKAVGWVGFSFWVGGDGDGDGVTLCAQPVGK